MTTNKRSPWRLRVLSLIGITNLAIFLFDTYVVPDSGISLLYAVSVLVTLFHPNSKITIATGEVMNQSKRSLKGMIVL